jgi:hypothetical protein
MCDTRRVDGIRPLDRPDLFAINEELECIRLPVDRVVVEVAECVFEVLFGLTSGVKSWELVSQEAKRSRTRVAYECLLAKSNSSGLRW